MPRTWKTPSPSPATATSTFLGTHFSYKQPSSSLKIDFIHTELFESPGVRRGWSVYSLCRGGETASESWRNWERSQPKSERTVGGIWHFFCSESMVHLMPLMSNVRYQFDHLLVCHYAKLLRLSLKLTLMAEQGEWILTEFRIMTDNQKVFYA